MVSHRKPPAPSSIKMGEKIIRERTTKDSDAIKWLGRLNAAKHLA